MKTAIVGSSGYIAGYLIRALEAGAGIRDVLRIDQTPEPGAFLNLLEPERFDYDILDDVDHVIFTAAVSGPDKCADEYEFCRKINVDGTGYFIREALARGCKVLFFSSDAVFGDIPGEIYTEASETKAKTPYGCMKKAVEDRFRGDPRFKAIRLSYVVSARDRFVSYCLSCIQSGERADVFHPFYRSCITVSDVVQVVLWLMRHWDEYESAVLNVAGTELVSRVRIADELNRLLGNKLAYDISRPGDDFYRNRPAVTQMKSLYLERYGILEEKSFTERLKKELEDGGLL